MSRNEGSLVIDKPIYHTPEQVQYHTNMAFQIGFVLLLY